MSHHLGSRCLFLKGLIDAFDDRGVRIQVSLEAMVKVGCPSSQRGLPRGISSSLRTTNRQSRIGATFARIFPSRSPNGFNIRVQNPGLCPVSKTAYALVSGWRLA